MSTLAAQQVTGLWHLARVGHLFFALAVTNVYIMATAMCMGVAHTYGMSPLQGAGLVGSVVVGVAPVVLAVAAPRTAPDDGHPLQTLQDHHPPYHHSCTSRCTL